jgi:bifunctional UDP-N-acetylglucosamine pyrophosphorylase/glucosamine-1-phosphate N-acetyltransferase
MALAIAILAAGKGTRLQSKRPKVLHTIGGRSLLLHVIHAALQVVPAADVYVIIGHGAEQVRTAVEHTGVRFVEQREQRGTGHALQQTLTALRNYENVLVLSGDVPLLKSETILALRDFHLREGAAMSILSADLEKPFGYGRILRRKPGRPEVKAIIEQKELEPGQDAIHEINSGIYAFGVQHLMQHADLLKARKDGTEVYLTDIAALLTDAGERVLALPCSSATEILGANTIAEMMALDSALRLQTVERHMAAGVTIFQPATVVIDSAVTIGPDTILEPFVQLLGSTRIGSHTHIRSYSVVENAIIGNHVRLRHGTIVQSSEVRDHALLGPYAHIRPESLIEEGAHIGNFVELKKTHMGKGAKANHLAYLGDSEIGQGANIGAGTIVCNFDGVDKHRTHIGDNAFIGSDSVLVAPLSIGNGAYVAAASCITENVPAEALAVSRARQVNKEGWASRRRSRQPIQGKTKGPPPLA